MYFDFNFFIICWNLKYFNILLNKYIMSATLIENTSIIALSFTAMNTPGFTGDASGLINVPVNNVILDNPNSVVITDGTNHLVTEQFLDTNKGGLGNDFSNSTGVLIVNSGIVNTIPCSSTSEANTLVQRDSDQNFSANNITATNLIQNISLGASITYAAGYVQTTNTTPTPIYVLTASSSGVNGTTYHIMFEISLADVTSASNTGSLSGEFRVKNIGGNITINGIYNLLVSLDSSTTTGLIPITITVGTVPNVNINVVPAISDTINWAGSFRISRVDF